jgi:hypothetical protein
VRWSELARESAGRGSSRGSFEQMVQCSMSVARQIVLQVAAQDIGQLTDLELPPTSCTRIPPYFGVSSEATYRVAGKHADVCALWGELLPRSKSWCVSYVVTSLNEDDVPSQVAPVGAC